MTVSLLIVPKFLTAVEAPLAVTAEAASIVALVSLALPFTIVPPALNEMPLAAPALPSTVPRLVMKAE